MDSDVNQALDVDGQTDEVFLDHLHAATFQYTPLGRTILGPAHNVKINKVLTPMSRRMTRNKCDRWFGDRGSHFCHHLDHLITHTRPKGQKGLTVKETPQMEFLPHVVDGTLRVITFSINAGKQDNVEMNAYILSNGSMSYEHQFRVICPLLVDKMSVYRFRNSTKSSSDARCETKV
ncbi:hypothetical protein YC2023_017200 [Brassica napus]